MKSRVGVVLERGREAYLFWGLTLLGWIWLWRYPIYSWDDFYFMTRQGLGHGRMTASGWFHDLGVDLWVRNGRTADAMGQAIQSLGPGLARILLALLCWAMCLGGYFWVAILGRLPLLPRWWRGLVAVTVAILPFFLAALDRGLGGDTLYFMAATFGYAGGLAFFLWGALPFLAMAVGRRTSHGALVFGSLLLTAAMMTHEVLAVMVLSMLAVFAMYEERRRLVARRYVTFASLFLIGAGRFLLPGLWARSQSGAIDPSRSPIATMCAGLRDLFDFQRIMGAVLLLSFAVVIFCVRGSLEMAHRALAGGPMIPLAAAGGGLVLPIIVGTGHGRPIFFAMFMAGIASMCLLSCGLHRAAGPTRIASFVVAALALAVIVGGGLENFSGTIVGLQKNAEVWGAFEAAAAQASTAGSGQVNIPLDLPAPMLTSMRPSIAMVRTYYDLPPGVVVTRS